MYKSRKKGEYVAKTQNAKKSKCSGKKQIVKKTTLKAKDDDRSPKIFVKIGTKITKRFSNKIPQAYSKS